MKKIACSTILLTILATISVLAQETDRMCGSVEKFNQTKRWQDLPGCATEEDEDSSQPIYQLNRLKYRYKEFYHRLETSMENRSHWVSIEDRVKELLPPERGAAYGDLWATDARLVAAKPLYQIALGDAAQRLKWRNISENGEDSLDTQVEVVRRELAKTQGVNPLMIKVSVDHIAPLVGKLKAAGAPDDLIVAHDSNQKKYTVSEIVTLIPKWRSSLAALESREESDYAAKWQPFLTALTGDRLELFKKYEVGTLQGTGGRMLRTPGDFKTATFYAKYTNGRSGILNRWNMTIWRFRGDKIVATQTRSGWGDDPPSSAFR